MREIDLNTPGPSQPPPLRPHALIAALQPLDQVRRLLATREQQDAHELFVVLAEAISDEAVKVAAEVVQLRGLADLVSLQAYCYLKGEKLPSPAPSTPSSLSVDRKPGRDKRKRAKGLAQPWEGLIARRRVCRRCGYHGEVRMDTLGGMELPVPISVSRPSRPIEGRELIRCDRATSAWNLVSRNTSHPSFSAVSPASSAPCERRSISIGQKLLVLLYRRIRHI